MDEDQGDELDQARAHLLSAPGPEAGDPLAALRLLARLDAEADALLVDDRQPDPDELAGYRRRRAYVWVHLAENRGESVFTDTAAAAVRAWLDAEAAVIRGAVEEAATA
ncbi:hypothetical protein [Kitasatospora sp. NBC_01302]|uniref:hypothetical protein n=1 Tax=Kitasatospora sp. NBC_01302 TaxID=2903575 RepID=UPI002E13159C|nr:hypothetical protein OG294_40810 [Kitasatospora sp. NBC_01302]